MPFSINQDIKQEEALGKFQSITSGLRDAKAERRARDTQDARDVTKRRRTLSSE